MAAEATGSEGLLVEGWQADKGTEGATTSVMARQQPEQRPTTNQRQQQQTAADSGRQQAVMVEGRETGGPELCSCLDPPSPLQQQISGSHWRLRSGDKKRGGMGWHDRAQAAAWHAKLGRERYAALPCCAVQCRAMLRCGDGALKRAVLCTCAV